MENQPLFFRRGPHSESAQMWPVPKASDQSCGTLECQPCWPPEPGDPEVASGGGHKNQEIRGGYKVLSEDSELDEAERSGKMVLSPPSLLPSLQESISANEPPSKESWALFNQVPLHEALGWVSLSAGVLDWFLSSLESCGSPGHQLCCLSRLDVLKACLSGASLKSWGAQCEVQILHFSGREFSPIFSHLLLLLSHFGHTRFFASLWTVTHQAPLSIGSSRQECWSGQPFPSPGDLSDPGIEPRSPALQADSLPPAPPGKWVGFMSTLCVNLSYLLDCGVF